MWLVTPLADNQNGFNGLKQGVLDLQRVIGAEQYGSQR
jgi:hypothetical protein